MDINQKPAEVVYIRKDQLAKARIWTSLCDVGPDARADKEPIYTHAQVVQAVREAVQKLLAEFPLFDDNGLDEEDHCCEWSLQQDRKRLHSMIAAAKEETKS